MPLRRREKHLTAELLALVDRQEPDPGPDPERIALTDDDYAAMAQDILAGKGEGPLWLFGYGSLLWNPGFDFARRMPARSPAGTAPSACCSSASAAHPRTPD